MNRSMTSLVVAAALLAAVPALAHGSHAVSPHQSHEFQEHETHELQEKVNGLNKDVAKDNRKLTADEQRLIALEMRAAESKVGKAAPLSLGQQRELAALRNQVGRLDRDIARDNKQLTTDETKLKVSQGQPSP